MTSAPMPRHSVPRRVTTRSGDTSTVGDDTSVSCVRLAAASLRLELAGPQCDAPPPWGGLNELPRSNGSTVAMRTGCEVVSTILPLHSRVPDPARFAFYD